jgi:hypothetical protein
MNTHLITRNWQYVITTLLLLMLVAINGCKHTDDEPTNGSSELLISLTDAPGGFSTYTVDVLSLTLTTASGAVVETLPVNTRVDFAQYTDLSEFLTAATVPSARYVRATMQLDYRNAEIWVANSTNSDAIKVVNFTDPDGNVIETIDVTVHLENRNSLLIVPGVPAFLTLDFNLDASNEVVFDAMGDPTLIVQPLLIAETEPERPKIHRVRGPLLEVDATNNRFELVIRPFIHHITQDDRRFGHLPVRVNNETIYDINGQRYQGQAGLNALAALPTFTATVALGDFRFRTHRFEATQVFAGSSVPGGDMDVVSGNVTQRIGNTLTVQGATLIRSDGTVLFNNSVQVDVSADTGVRKQLSLANHTIDEVSVGQRVTIFGNLLVTIPESPPVLDATAADHRVFMNMTVLRGFAVDSMGPLVANLQTINFRHISLFDFSGTGTDTGNDADPAYYEIDTGALDTSGIANGSPIAVGGFATPFGQAPLDFEARTVVDLSAIPGVMAVNWDPAAATAFESMSAEGIVLDLTGSGVFHHIGRAGVRVDLTSLLVSPTIEPTATSLGVYVIIGNALPRLFTNFDLYVEALQSDLDSGSSIKGLIALGDYDDVTASITAERILTRIQ